MNILALDMATKTGWAAKTEWQENVLSGVVEFTMKRGESPGMRFLRCRGWLKEMAKLMGHIDLVVYEQAHHRGGAATALCVGLTTEAQAFAAGMKADTMAVHTATLKKWATGNGRAGKPEMIKAAQALGYAPATHDEADALLLLEHARAELGV